jgi:hypothetical protein
MWTWLPFSPQGSCLPGGFYFTEENKIALWINYQPSVKYIRKVILPDDARVCIEQDTIKCDRFILEERILLQEFPLWSNHDFCTLVVQYGHALQYVMNQTDELCRLAVQRSGYTLQFVRKQTDELCTMAVQQNGCALKYVVNQTDELCRIAVQCNSYALQYVVNQTDDLCRLAVQRDCNALQFVRNQTVDLHPLAVQLCS